MQTWMAENLNYQTGKSWCYGDNASNCSKYGRLYNWNTARSVCPAGWHLPTREELDALGNAIGDETGTKLKSPLPDWNGSDEFGFSALPGGNRYADRSFRSLGSWGNWWMAAENGTSRAYYWYMGTGYADVRENNNYKIDGFSVRCLQD
jgi:uncharacterized protein (TIGR02145 family)